MQAYRLPLILIVTLLRVCSKPPLTVLMRSSHLKIRKVQKTRRKKSWVSYPLAKIEKPLLSIKDVGAF